MRCCDSVYFQDEKGEEEVREDGQLLFYFVFFSLKLEGRDWGGVAMVLSSNLLFLSANKSDKKALSQGSIINNKVQPSPKLCQPRWMKRLPFRLWGRLSASTRSSFTIGASAAGKKSSKAGRDCVCMRCALPAVTMCVAVLAKAYYRLSAFRIEGGPRAFCGKMLVDKTVGSG